MNWIVNNTDLIGQMTLAHLAVALPPVLLSFLISIPLGWLANRYRSGRGVILSLSGLLYAIPSLPLFIVLPALIGTGLRDPVNVVIALTIYGVALMVRSVADGLASVDQDVRQSATAVGFSPASQFFRVEFPLAGPVLIAGIRVVAVSTMSLTTVAAVLGIPSLGLFFTDGVQRGIPSEIWTGIVMTIVLALLLDLVIVVVGRMLLPWARRPSTRALRRSTRRAQSTGSQPAVTA